MVHRAQKENLDLDAVEAAKAAAVHRNQNLDHVQRNGKLKPVEAAQEKSADPGRETSHAEEEGVHLEDLSVSRATVDQSHDGQRADAKVAVTSDKRHALWPDPHQDVANPTHVKRQ